MIHSGPTTYQIAIQTGMAAHYARTTLRVSPAPEDGVRFELNESSIRIWLEPIITGAKCAVNQLRERGYLSSPLQVTILDFWGLGTDTRDVEAYWSAFMAVVRSFPGFEEASLEYRPKEKDFSFSWPNPSGVRP